MISQAPECPRCRRAMEPGFIMDQGHGAVYRNYWVEGAPNYSQWWGVRVKKGTRKLQVTTYRCTSCGRLEAYANETSER